VRRANDMLNWNRFTRYPALALCLCAAGLISCGRGNDDAETQPELLFFCGAGLRAPVQELIAEFENAHSVKIAADYAGSERLLSKLKVSRTGDLYLPGDRRYVELLAGTGLVKSRKRVCWFVPVIMVAKGNPKGIQSPADLLRSDVKLGLGDENACAIGRLMPKLFEKNGIDWVEARERITFGAPTVNVLCEHIEVGSLDAVIVWDGNAAGYLDKADVIPIPTEKNTMSTVEIAALTSRNHPELATAFTEFLASKRGREVFNKQGYTVQDPTGPADRP
jgi:molybdate transport system substrate-binding protein